MTFFHALMRTAAVAGLLATASVSLETGAYAADPMVGGAPMSPQKTIVENASKASNLTTLVAAVKAAGLVETLMGPGPFTVFAPTDAAFDKVPKETLAKLLQPDMKPTLQKILTYHVVAGTLTAADLVKQVKSMGGMDALKTVEGGTLTAKMDGDKLVLVDEMGGTATVETADVMQSNGVVHVIDSVLMPK